MLLRIEAPHFVAGVVFNSAAMKMDHVPTAVRCAPIVKYMRGWSEHRIRRYCEDKGWRCERVGA